MKPIKRHISGFSDHEYLELLQKLANQQYDDNYEEEQDLFSDAPEEWTYEEQPRKPQYNPSYECIDLSSAKLEVIKNKLQTSGNIKVGQFIIKIIKYDIANTNDIKLDINILEEKQRIFNGNPGKIAEKINLSKDTRFNNQEWIKYFNNSIKSGIKIPIETVANIIKYMQFVYKNAAFL